MTERTSEWSVVGSYRRRPVPQGEILDLLSAASNEVVSAADAPILIYDTVSFPSGQAGSSGSGGGASAGAASTSTVTPALRVPRYIARKIDIPPPPQPASSSSASASAEDPPLKVISLAPPFSLRDVADPREVLNIDCPETSQEPAGANRRNHHVSSALLLTTTIPAPSQLSFILPFVLFLGDIAVLVVSLTTRKTRKEFIAACCVLVVVPDVASLVFIVKKGSILTSIALHLLLWANVILLILQPYSSPLFFIHFILMVFMILFVLRLRGSSRSTFCALT